MARVDVAILFPVMRTHPLRRLAAALLNLFFLLAWGEPAALHPCPMHDGVTVVAAAGAHGTATAGASTPSMAAHASHEMPADGGAGHACNCLGQCSVAAGVIAPTAQAIRWQVVVHRRVPPEYDAPAAPRAAADRLLPFANGPPRAA